MKIKINENETYEVKINEGIYSAEEFLSLLERLTGVLTTLMEQKSVIETQQIKTRETKLGRIRGEIPEGIRCPVCANNDLFKQGFSNTRGEKIQRYSCKQCGRSFKEDFAIKSGEQPYATTKTKRSPMRIRWENREDVLKAIKIHYFGTQEEKEAFAKSKHKDVTWLHINKSLGQLRRRYDIKPEEVGLNEFPAVLKKSAIQKIQRG